MNSRTAALWLTFLPASLVAQTGGVTGVVVSRSSGDPLAYSIVGLDSIERTAFTSDSGRFGIRLIPVGAHVKVNVLGNVRGATHPELHVPRQTAGRSKAVAARHAELRSIRFRR